MINNSGTSLRTKILAAVIVVCVIGACKGQTGRVDSVGNREAVPTLDTTEYLRVSSWYKRPNVLGKDPEVIMLSLLNSSKESLLIPVDPLVTRFIKVDSSNIDFLTAEFFGVDVVAVTGTGYYNNPMSEFYPPLLHYSTTIVELPPGDSALLAVPLERIVDPRYRTSKPINVRIMLAFFTCQAVDTTLLNAEVINSANSCIDTTLFIRATDYSSFIAVDANHWVRKRVNQFKRTWCVSNVVLGNEVDRTEFLRVFTGLTIELDD